MLNMKSFVFFENFFCAYGDEYEIIADDCIPRNAEDWLHHLVRKLSRRLTECYAGHPKCFPIAYWLLFIFALIGSFQSLSEFLKVYNKNADNRVMWHNQRFSVIPATIFRKWQVGLAFINLNSWLLLWYAAINIESKYIHPWIVVEVIAYLGKAKTHVFEKLFLKKQLEKRILVHFFLSLLIVFCLAQVSKIFKKAIELEGVENLYMFQKYMPWSS